MLTASVATRVALFGTVILQGACATLIHGTKQTIPVTSSPTGATVAVDSVPVGRTPLTVAVSRIRAHVVTVTSDNGVKVDVALVRTLSPTVWWNITLYGLPAFIDFSNGAAFRLGPDSLHVELPADATIAGDAKPGLTVSGGNKVRMRTNDSPREFVYAIVDSTKAEGLVVRTSADSVSQPSGTPAIIAESDVRRLDFVASPERGVNGQLAMRVASLGTLAAGAAITGDLIGTLFLGGLYNIVAGPVSFALGYAGGAPRWSPREARRIGSPLLVGDRVRLQLANSSSRLIKGRFIDIDSAGLFVASKRDTMRVLRANVVSVERIGGLSFGKAALIAVGVGALIGVAEVASRDFPQNGSEWIVVPFSGAFLALYSMPAFAPRRWVKVSKW